MGQALAPAETLGLVGDGDEFDVIGDLERSFAVDFGRRPEAWTTVGDIEADLLALYPAADAPGLCSSAMAFRHLRAALPTTARRARPGTPLASLLPGETRRRIDARFGRDGLIIPASRGGPATTLGLLVLFAGLLMLAPLFVLGLGWAGGSLDVAGVALVALDRGVPADTTLGELARTTAAMNFASFADRGADRRPAAIRAGVRRILGRKTCVDPRTIGSGTRLFG